MLALFDLLTLWTRWVDVVGPEWLAYSHPLERVGIIAGKNKVHCTKRNANCGLLRGLNCTTNSISMDSVKRCMIETHPLTTPKI